MQEDNEFRFQELEKRGKRRHRRQQEAEALPAGRANDTTRDRCDRRRADGTAAAPDHRGDAARRATRMPRLRRAAAPTRRPDLGTITVDQNGNVKGGSIGEPVDDRSAARRNPSGDNTTVAALPATDDPDELYRNSYQFILSGDYGTAEAGFRDHIARFPTDPKAADAHYWLGESLLGQKKYRDAAEVFLAANHDYPDSAKAPDMLLKLGVSLNGLQPARRRLRHLQGDRQALPQIVGRAEAAGQAGTGAGRVLSAAFSALPSHRPATAFSDSSSSPTGARPWWPPFPAAATRWRCCSCSRIISAARAPRDALVAVTVDHGLRAAVGRPRRWRSPRFASANGIAHRINALDRRQAGDRPAGGGARGALPPARRGRGRGGTDLVLTGHTLDDQIETVDDARARAATAAGSPAWRRRPCMTAVWILRPLLGTAARRAARAAAPSAASTWIDDPTNVDRKYERARLRRRRASRPRTGSPQSMRTARIAAAATRGPLSAKLPPRSIRTHASLAARGPGSARAGFAERRDARSRGLCAAHPACGHRRMEQLPDAGAARAVRAQLGRASARRCHGGHRRAARAIFCAGEGRGCRTFAPPQADLGRALPDRRPAGWRDVAPAGIAAQQRSGGVIRCRVRHRAEPGEAALATEPALWRRRPCQGWRPSRHGAANYRALGALPALASTLRRPRAAAELARRRHCRPSRHSPATIEGKA